jgi:hypothetical protein
VPVAAPVGVAAKRVIDGDWFFRYIELGAIGIFILIIGRDALTLAQRFGENEMEEIKLTATVSGAG